MHYSLLLGIALTLSKVSADYITPDYPICKECKIVYQKDNNAWGIDGHEWCNIDAEKCSSAIADYKNPAFWSKIQGLPRCDHCSVVFKDAFGQYGISEDEDTFCGIDPLTCYQKAENVSTKEYKFYDKFGLPACDKDHCELVYKDEYGEYGLMNDTWCGIDMDICQKGYPTCKSCDVIYVDDEYYGVMDSDWCIVDTEKCNLKPIKKTTTTKKSTTNKKSATTKSESTATATPFWSQKQNLPRCDHCDAVYEDQYGKYGRIEGKDYFCGIDPVTCPNVRVPRPPKKILWFEKWGYQECVDCEVVHEDEFGRYGVNHGDWCGISEACTQFPTCDNCDAVFEDDEGVFGVMGDEWCLINTKICGNVHPSTTTKKTTTTKKSTTTTKKSTTTTKKSTTKKTTTTTTSRRRSTTPTYKKPTSTPTPKTVFWSEKIGYPRCDHCDIEYTDKYGNWGVMKGEWCGISPDCTQCIGAGEGYKCCETCEVVFVEGDSLWGIENSEWCSIKFSCSL